MKTISSMSELQEVCEQAKAEFMASLAYETIAGIQPVKPNYSNPAEEAMQLTVQQWVEKLERDGCERGRVKVKFNINRRFIGISGLVVEFRSGTIIFGHEYDTKTVKDICWIDKKMQSFVYPDVSFLL